MAQFVRRSLRLLMLYGPLLFIPAFLYLAYVNISSKLPEYKVSASISAEGISSQSAISALKSKELINRALDQMPLEASYFFSDQPMREIYPDSSPVKVVIKSLKNSITPAWISLRATDSREFELTKGDTSEFYRFNVPVSEPYGTFTVVRNNKAGSAGRQVNVEMLARPQMVNIIYKDLYVTTGHSPGVIQLALVTGNPKKGADLLNALLNIYGGRVSKGSDVVAATKMVTTVQYDTIKRPGKDLSALKNKAAELTSQITSLKEQEKSAGTTIQARRGGVDRNQERIYQAVDSYIKQPIDQFVQVPYVDEIEDPDLNDQVNEFNEFELSRSHYAAQDQIDSMNRKLMTLRSSIVEKIRAYLQNGHGESGSQPPRGYYEGQIAAKQRRLDDINNKISAVAAPAFVVVKRNKDKAVSTARTSPKLVVLAKPEDNIEYIPVNKVMIYGLAFLAGLLFPIAGWIVRVVHRGYSSRRPVDPQKLNGQINDFFHARQID